MIVPFYNSAAYMQKTVPTFLNQTYENIEFLFIDDGSTDDTAKLLKQIELENPEVIVISQTNQGNSSARNVGLDAARGELITFVDSDDYLAIDYISTLVAGFELTDDVFMSAVGFKVISEYKQDDFTRLVSDSLQDSEVVTGEQALVGFLTQKDNFDVSVWAKMFKAEAFDTVRFTQGILFEDFDIIVRLFEHHLEEAAVLNNSVLYGYYARESSIMHRPYVSTEISVIDVVNSNEQVAANLTEPVVLANSAKSLSALAGVMLKAIKSNNSDSDIIYKKLTEFRRIRLLFKEPTIKAKILIALLFGGKKFFEKMLVLSRK